MIQKEDATGIYVASKTKHSAMWQRWRETFPIISTWIDEADKGASRDLPGLAIRCIQEPSSASATIAYAEEGEVMKGALIEIGAALAAGRKVFIVGPVLVSGAFEKHPAIRYMKTLAEAFEAAMHEMIYRPAAHKEGEQSAPPFSHAALNDLQRFVAEIIQEDNDLQRASNNLNYLALVEEITEYIFGNKPPAIAKPNPEPLVATLTEIAEWELGCGCPPREPHRCRSYETLEMTITEMRETAATTLAQWEAPNK